MKRPVAAVVLAALVAGAAATAIVTRTHGSPNERAARAQFARARAYLAAGQLGAHADETVAVMRAHPTYLEPFLYRIYGTFATGLIAHNRQREEMLLVDALADTSVRACLRTLHRQSNGYCEPASVPLEVRDAGAVCQLVLGTDFATVDATQYQRLLAQAARVLPDSPTLLAMQLAVLRSQGRDEELWRVAGELLRPGHDALLRSLAYGMRALAAHRLGKHEAAVAAERAGLAFARAAGAGALGQYAEALSFHGAESEVAADARGEADAAGRAQQEHARATYALAVALRQEAAARGDDYARLRWELDEGVRRLDTGDLVGSGELLDRAVASATALHDTTVLAVALMRRGRLAVKRGDLASAQPDLLHADELPPLSPAAGHDVPHNLFHLYESLGDDARAEAAGLRFIRTTEEGGDCAVRIVAYRDVALFYQRRGRTRDADRLFRQMVQSIRRQQREYLWAGEYFELTGDLDEAERYYRLEWERGTSALRALPGLVRLAVLRGDTARARHWARLHDEWLLAQRNPEAVPLLPGTLAAGGDLPAAAAQYERACAHAAERGQLASWATLTVDRAGVELRAGLPQTAAPLADSASIAADRLGLPDLRLRATSLAELARIADAAGGGTTADARRALARLRSARAEAEHIRLPALSAELWRAEGDGDALLGNVDAALSAYLHADILTDSIALSLTAAPDRASFRAARIGISNRALSLVLRAGGPLASDRFAAWSAQRKARTLTEPRLRSEPAPLSAVQRALRPEDAIIDYTLLDTAAVALAITRDRVALIRLPATAAAIGDASRRLRLTLEPRVGTQLDVARARLDVTTAAWLYDVLLRPLGFQLDGKRRLYVVPDGELHLLPFDALISRAGPAPTYLVDTHELVLLPSLLSAARAQPPLDLRRVLLVGATRTRPAPGSDSEILAVTDALAPTLPTVLQHAGATASALRQALPGASAVHFAVHAEPNEVEPLLAVLHLEPEAGSDGSLMAAEIATLDFAGRSVVLSGCETAAGRLLAGEGVLNLSRAFLAAGARSTLATLWPVGEATAPFMAAYYRALGQGSSAPAALRTAKLQLRKRPELANPVYWAPFVHIASALEPRL